MISAPGLYKALVTTNADPEGFNRVKAICPQVFGDDQTESDWAWPMVMPGWTSTSAILKSHRTVTLYTGGGTGISSNQDVAHVLDFPSPNPGQGVWMAFEGGDIEYPIWLGVWK